MDFLQHACVLYDEGRIDLENYPLPIYAFSIDEAIEDLRRFKVGKCIVVGYTETSEVKKIVSEFGKNALFLSVAEATAIRSLSDVQHDRRCAHKVQTNHCGVTVIVGEGEYYYVFTFRHLQPDNVDYTSRLMHQGTLPDANFSDNVVFHSTEKMIFVGKEFFLDYAWRMTKLDACDYVDHKNNWDFVRDGAFLKAQNLWPYSSLRKAPQPTFVDKTGEEEEHFDHRAAEDNVLAIERVVSRAAELSLETETDPQSQPVNSRSTYNAGVVSFSSSSSTISKAIGVLVHVSGRDYVRFLDAESCTWEKRSFDEIPSLRGKVSNALMLNFNIDEGIYQIINMIVNRPNIFFVTSTGSKLTNFLSSESAPTNPADYIYAIEENNGKFLIATLEEGVENSYKIHPIANSVEARRIGADIRITCGHVSLPLILLSYASGSIESQTHDNGFVTGSFAVQMTQTDDRKGICHLANTLCGTENACVAFL